MHRSDPASASPSIYMGKNGYFNRGLLGNMNLHGAIVIVSGMPHPVSLTVAEGEDDDDDDDDNDDDVDEWRQRPSHHPSHHPTTSPCPAAPFQKSILQQQKHRKQQR